MGCILLKSMNYKPKVACIAVLLFAENASFSKQTRQGVKTRRAGVPRI